MYSIFTEIILKLFDKYLFLYFHLYLYNQKTFYHQQKIIAKKVVKKPPIKKEKDYQPSSI